MVFWHSVLVAGRFLQMIYDTVYNGAIFALQGKNDKY